MLMLYNYFRKSFIIELLDQFSILIQVVYMHMVNMFIISMLY
jgi:hypothetical protein